jgi:hypothetical protein
MSVCVYVCMSVCEYVYVCVYVCMCACLYVCMGVCQYVCMCMYVCVYVCMCVYLYVCGCEFRRYRLFCIDNAGVTMWFAGIVNANPFACKRFLPTDISPRKFFRIDCGKETRDHGC